MLRDRLLLGVRVGLVAAAATAGALIGFGWARGAPLQPLNSVAHVVLGSRAFYIAGLDALVTPAAVVVHTVSLVAWGALFAVAFGYGSPARAWVLAIVVAAVAAIVDFILLPARLSPGFETLLTRAEVIVVYLVMAAAMAFVGPWVRRSREATSRLMEGETTLDPRP